MVMGRYLLFFGMNQNVLMGWVCQMLKDTNEWWLNARIYKHTFDQSVIGQNTFYYHYFTIRCCVRMFAKLIWFLWYINCLSWYLDLIELQNSSHTYIHNYLSHVTHCIIISNISLFLTYILQHLSEFCFLFFRRILSARKLDNADTLLVFKFLSVILDGHGKIPVIFWHEPKCFNGVGVSNVERHKWMVVKRKDI